MWQIGRHTLRLTDAEFFNLTPRQFKLLVNAQRAKTEKEEFLFAQLVAALFAVNGAERNIYDFMPSHRNRKAPESAEPTPEERAAVASKTRSFFDLLASKPETK